MSTSHQQDSDAAGMMARTGRSYDAVPYLTIPFQRLQPQRLAATAQLLGLGAPDVHRARTLEIGCATGGHLIPLAARFPHAEFVGVDVSSAQIETGRARAAGLGLKNISLRAASVTEIDRSWGEFDYIICHGVYSWVPNFVREAIMRVCGENLSKEGIAVVSYNVLPGWRMFQVVRDSMILHAGGETDHATRSARARQLFDIMSRQSSRTNAYGAIWRTEAKRMFDNPDAYLAHELFEDENVPITFTEFAGAAARNGLAYLSESSVRMNIPDLGSGDRTATIRALTGGELIASEQYLDIMSGRTFRECLLIREARATRVDRSLVAERLMDLHFEPAGAFRATSPADQQELVLEDGEGNISSLSDPSLGAALRRLVTRAPASSSFNDLATGVAERPEQRDILMAALMQFMLQGAIQVSTAPVRCAASVAERPKAWPLAVEDAGRAEERSVTLAHAPFEITPALRFLLPLLDGRNSRDDIVGRLMDRALAGEIELTDKDGKVVGEDRLRTVCGAQIDSLVAYMARIGVLAD